MEKRLTHMQTVRLTTPGLYPDSGGLLLQVTTGRDGSPRKSWVFRYSLHGRGRNMGLGSFEHVSLADARAARDARAKILEGVDPIEARNFPAKTIPKNIPTFDECAAAYIKAHGPSWHSAKHRREWVSTLAAHVSPIIGTMPVGVVDTDLVLHVLEPMWSSKPTTASRVRGRIESVLAWATVRGFRAGANPAQWRNHLDQLLPAVRKVRPVRHMPAMPYAAIPAFTSRLRKINTIAARALEFTILTAARSGEIIGATWGEIDLDAKVWTIPASRMKARREHRVPLGGAAMTILETLPERGGYLFPGGRTPKLSTDCMRLLMRAIGAGGTVHGLRSSFRDWAGEETDFPREIAEAALAHTVGGVEGAYRRGDALEKRRALMEAWAMFVAGR